MSVYKLVHALPLVEEFCRLRTSAELSRKTREAAQVILHETWFAFTLCIQLKQSEWVE